VSGRCDYRSVLAGVFLVAVCGAPAAVA